MKRLIVVLALAAALAGCKTGSHKTAETPDLTIVGSGISVQRTALPQSFTAPEKKSFHSLWSGSNQGLFRDLRARKVGDVVTVIIDIDDKAKFDNASGRSRQGAAKGAVSGSVAFGGFGLGQTAADASGSVDMSGSASSKGTGTIDRSEKLRLSIAALVSEVLPDGNLLISGSQEIRVNHEVRVLNISGIVRPLDIGADNVIAYDRIAEARVSYGGRGKLSDVQ
ncbi:MAG: flagellar basal body L-ring protein FlgH [Rhizobiales bacterium]|nr:flagellar basal body L-ring protein FlgH [Hyphomicrobiales bacterium]